MSARTSARDAALPSPQADLPALDRIVQHLGLATARIEATTLVREAGRGWSLARAWSGPAFEAARAEAGVLAGHGRAFAEGLTPVVSALQGYAAAVAEARHRVSALQDEWDRGLVRHDRDRQAADAFIDDPALAATGAGAVRRAAAHQQADREWAALQEQLRGRHTVAVRPVTAAADRACATVRAFLADLPGDSAESIRARLLGDLPITEGALATREAHAVVAALLAAAGRPVDRWGAAEARLIGSLGERARDPRVAAALLEAVPPEALSRLVERLLAHVYSLQTQREEWTAIVDPALAVLGTAFATAASGGDTDRLDAGSAARLRAWRSGWLAELVRTGALASGDRLHDPPFSGFTAQAVLLGRAAIVAPGLTPDSAYAALVGTALVEADRVAPAVPPPGRGRWTVRSPADGVDPVEVLLRALRADPETASALLLGRLGDGRSVVSYLAGDRLLRRPGDPPMGATAALATVLALTATGSDARSVTIAGAALDGFGRAAEVAAAADGPAHALALEPQFQGLRQVMADLLARHPDAVWATVTDPIDAPDWPASDAAAHPWAVLGADGQWTVRLLNRARLAAIVGQLGRDGVIPGRPGEAASTPAVATLLNAVVAEEADGLATALRSGDPDERQAGLVRLGQVAGFLAEAARQGLLSIQIEADASAGARRARVDRLADAISLPAPVRKSLPTLVAGVVVTLLRKAVTWVGYGDTTVDNAARAARDADTARGRLETEVRRVGWDLVSAAGWWDRVDDPTAWIRARPGVSFCGPDGRPLPVAELSAAQRERLLAWSAGVPAYTTVPAELMANLEEGARAARTAGGAR